MQIKAVGTVDEIFEQVRPIFAACEVLFLSVFPYLALIQAKEVLISVIILILWKLILILQVSECFFFFLKTTDLSLFLLSLGQAIKQVA